MLEANTKQKIIKKFRTHSKDTGSPEVQIAILSEEIKLLTEHLKLHRHDYSSRRGLLKKVHQRRALLRYLLRENKESYMVMIKKLKLKEFKKDKSIEEDIVAEEVANGEKTETKETKETEAKS